MKNVLEGIKTKGCGSVDRSQKQGMQQWDQGSRGSRRPDWDDRFIVPGQHRQGRRQVDDMVPVHSFRASTPDRVLKEASLPSTHSYCVIRIPV